jgi:diguanylate cyclase (GGDEF)-like protein/PAS domain S-box-containing protein
MSHVFLSEYDEPLDAHAREQALAWLLDRYPKEPVAAFDATGMFAAVPESIALRDNNVMEGRSGLDSMSDEAGRQAMIERWEKMLARGANNFVVPRPGLSDVTCYWLDLRELHGVIFTMIVGVLPEERDDTDPSARVLATPPPRLASLRKDERAAIKSIDQAFTDILGWTEDELDGKRSLDILHPDDHQLAIENWVEMMARPGPARRLRQRMLHKDGHLVWFEVVNNNLLGDPEYGCVVCEMVDISEEMAAQEALRAREQLLDRLTASLPVGVLQIDTERHVVFTNERLQDILGAPSAETLVAQVANVLPADRPRLEQAIETVLRDGSNTEVDVCVQLPESTDVRRCNVSFRPLSHDDGTISGAIACVDDVTERARMQDELKRRATFDDLTGCHNRTSVVNALEDTIASGRGKAERAVMFVDLDGFKDINDRYGHATGDELLRRVATRLLEAVRDTDIVGRIGGDEFLVVCPDIGGPEPAMRLAERIADAVYTDDVEAGAEDVECRVSIGVTWCSGNRLNADALVAMADRAMYESKRARNGRPMLATEPEPGAPEAPEHGAPAYAG